MSNNLFLAPLTMSENHPFLWTPKTTPYDVRKFFFIVYENPITCCHSLLKHSEKLTLLWTPKTPFLYCSKTPVTVACLECDLVLNDKFWQVRYFIFLFWMLGFVRFLAGLKAHVFSGLNDKFWQVDTVCQLVKISSLPFTDLLSKWGFVRL